MCVGVYVCGWGVVCVCVWSVCVWSVGTCVGSVCGTQRGVVEQQLRAETCRDRETAISVCVCVRVCG